MSYKQYNPATNKSDELHYNMHSLYGRLQIEPTLTACRLVARMEPINFTLYLLYSNDFILNFKNRLSTNERCIVVTRSTYPGSGKYGGHWLGDNTSMWKHLRASIIGEKLIDLQKDLFDIFRFIGIQFVWNSLRGC